MEATPYSMGKKPQIALTKLKEIPGLKKYN
jgi:hypothetical protein